MISRIIVVILVVNSSLPTFVIIRSEIGKQIARVDRVFAQELRIRNTARLLALNNNLAIGAAITGAAPIRIQVELPDLQNSTAVPAQASAGQQGRYSEYLGWPNWVPKFAHP